MKNKMIGLISISVFMILLVISVIVSYNVTSVLNPISSIYSVLKVNADKDKIYVMAQKKPWKVMIAKSDMNGKSGMELLNEYMENDGYFESDRMGSIITYKNKQGNERRIHYSVNKYYSLWEWI